MGWQLTAMRGRTRTLRPREWRRRPARLLWPGGRLVFLRSSPLFALCVPAKGQVGNALLHPQFGLCRLDWGRSAEFNLPHGEMLRLLRFQHLHTRRARRSEPRRLVVGADQRPRGSRVGSWLHVR